MVGMLLLCGSDLSVLFKQVFKGKKCLDAWVGSNARLKCMGLQDRPSKELDVGERPGMVVSAQSIFCLIDLGTMQVVRSTSSVD